jgi:replicative superfamily II helicase
MGTMEALIAAVEANTAAVEKMTAALAAGGAAPAKAADKKPPAKQAEKAKSQFTAEQVRDKFIELKDATDEATAKTTIEAQGVKKLAELVADPSKWDAAMAAAQELIDAAADDGDGGL